MMRALNSCVEDRAAWPQQLSGRSFPKTYYVIPPLVARPETLNARLELWRGAGFGAVCCAPLFAPGPSGDVFLAGDIEAAHPILQVDTADRAVGERASACRGHQLRLIVDIVLDRVDAGGRLAGEHPDMFDVRAPHTRPVDPRAPLLRSDAAYARIDQPGIAQRLLALWVRRLGR